MRCHHATDPETGKKYLIPGCHSVSFHFHLDDATLMKHYCTCREDNLTAKEFERDQYNETVAQLRTEIKDLEKYNAQLQRQLRKMIRRNK